MVNWALPYADAEDAERAAASVRTSIEQLLDTAAGKSRAANLPHTPAAPVEPDSFDVCKNNNLVERPQPLAVAPGAYRDAYASDLREVLLPTPVPGLGPGLGAMPRFRSEVGPFVGMSGMIDARGIDGGFTLPGGSGVIGGVEVAAKAGLGLMGLRSASGDGLVSSRWGSGDSTSTNSVADTPLAQAGRSLPPRFPAAVLCHVGCRHALLPDDGDLRLLAPIYFISKSGTRTWQWWPGTGA